MNTFIIDGKDFDTYDEIYFRIKELIVKDKESNKENLNLHEMIKKHLDKYAGDVEFVWKNSDKSKSDFGYAATASHFRQRMAYAPLHDIPYMVLDLKRAERFEGKTLFDKVIDCFTGNNISVVFE